MTNLILILAFAALCVGAGAVFRLRREFLVTEGFAGLLYHHGKLVQALSAGRHVRFGRNFRLVQLDTRKAVLNVAGQEVLTSDNVGVKISLVLITQITDAGKTQSADNYIMHLYSAAQAAMRTVVAAISIDVLLAQRVSISAQLRELLAPPAEALGLLIHSAEVRDVMLPGELRKAFSEVLKARQEGLAALERARGESAALRNLANAARVLDEQPALMSLRFLQSLEASKQTVVLNDLSALAMPRAKKSAD